MTALAILRRELRAYVPPGAIRFWLLDAAATFGAVALLILALAMIWAGCEVL